jgi:hypothetical protein
MGVKIAKSIVKGDESRIVRRCDGGDQKVKGF